MNAMMADKLEIVPNADLMPAVFESFYIDYLACEDEMMEQTTVFEVEKFGAIVRVITLAACGVELNRRFLSKPAARKLWAELAAAPDYRARKHANDC